MKTYFQLLLLIILCSACRNAPKHAINFYYWKTNIAIDTVEKEYFSKLDAQKLYIRLFDVDNESGEAFPKAEIKPFDATVLPTEYIPVIFITNRTFISLKDTDIHPLAQKIYGLIHQIEEANALPQSSEIQIDCDWTERTRTSFFRFLSELKELSNRDISSTLRLHQLKYKERIGIPPVSKVYLMCYATSEPTEKTAKNSILDIDLLKDYTENIQNYPLSLDIALPLFSWGVVTNHLGRIKLINGLTHKELQTPAFEKWTENTYKVTEDLFLQGFYLNKGFTIRIEEIDSTLLYEAKNYLDKKLKRDYSIVYYHLDKLFLQKFTIDELK